jgi:hypothetical protein
VQTCVAWLKSHSSRVKDKEVAAHTLIMDVA